MRTTIPPLTEDVAVCTIKNPNRFKPTYLFKRIIPHMLRRVPKSVEVLANKKGNIIHYTESPHFNNPAHKLLNNFKIIRVDKDIIYIEYGFLGEFGINETFELTIRVY